MTVQDEIDSFYENMFKARKCLVNIMEKSDKDTRFWYVSRRILSNLEDFLDSCDLEPSESKILEPPVKEIPKVEEPKVIEVPKVETPTLAPVEIPKVEETKIVDTPKVEMPPVLAPKVEEPKVIEVPKVETPTLAPVEIPKVEETKIVDTPKVENSAPIPGTSGTMATIPYFNSTSTTIASGTSLDVKSIDIKKMKKKDIPPEPEPDEDDEKERKPKRVWKPKPKKIKKKHKKWK